VCPRKDLLQESARETLEGTDIMVDPGRSYRFASFGEFGISVSNGGRWDLAGNAKVISGKC
jgi:hypothetical protein